MSLLSRVQSSLNKLYDGNITAHNSHADYESGVRHKDQYECDCGNIVEEHEWIAELKMCKECYSEHYGGLYTSHDQIEYQQGE